MPIEPRARLAAALAAALLFGCGSAAPQQATSLAPTRTLSAPGSPTVPPEATPTDAPGVTRTVNAPATSRAVILTITALAATPTYPPTATARPTRMVVGAGPEDAPIAPPSRVGVTAHPLAFQVARGGAAALTVRAPAGALCALWRVPGPGRREAVPGVSAAPAPADGVIAWIWTVAGDLPPGPLDLLVDCGAAGSAAARIDVLR